MPRHSWASALLIGVVCSVLPVASAQDAGIRDAYGRPLADYLGPIRYSYDDGERWIAIHADGSHEPAPPMRPEVRLPLTAGSSPSGYGLDAYASFEVGSWPYAVAIGDVTGDGRADVVMATTSYFDPVNDYSVFVFPQEASGTLGTPRKYRYIVPTYLAGLVVADLDENGVQDVVVGHSGGITVFLADGDGGLLPGAVLGDGDAGVLQATDVDRDGHVDIVSLGQSRGATVFFGDGHGGFPRRVPVATNADGFNDLEVGDLNGDDLPDLAIANGSASSPIHLSIHRNDRGGGLVSPPDPYEVESFLFRAGIGVGDVTGDGLSDAVVSRPRNTPTWLWIMPQDSSGTLTGPTPLTSYDIPEPVVVTDLDRDGRADIAVLHGGWNRAGIYLQGPGGQLGSEALYVIPYASSYPPQALAVGDFTSDGCPDVAIADYNSGLVVLHGLGCVPHCETDNCDDLNPCTDDSCDPSTGCVHVNNTTPCDDGNVCTTNDTCGGGDCHGGGSNTCAGTLGMFTDTNGVAVFDADKDTKLGKLSIGSPRDCSIDAKQMQGFVSDAHGNVWVIDLTKSPPKLASGVNPIRIANDGVDTTISPDQRYLLVCDGVPGHPLSVVDIGLRREIGTIPVECTSVETCTDGSVIVTSHAEVRRFTIDRAGRLDDTGEQVSAPFSGPVNSMCGPQSRTAVYLARQAMGSFGIPGMAATDAVDLPDYPFSGAINRSGDRLFLRGVSQVAAYSYDETTGAIGDSPIFTIVPNVNSGGYFGVDEIAVHPNGTKLYTLGDQPIIKMNAYSTATGDQVASISADAYPSGVCFSTLECAPGAPSQCDDANACTADACDAIGRCVHEPVLCHDGSVCTADTCDPASGCVFPPIGCDDADCCTVDSCDPVTGCSHAPNTTAPVFSVQPSFGDCPTLWPPNHLYADFTVAETGAVASSMCGIASIEFAGCSSSQPENGPGTADGNTTRDCVFEPRVLHLRAERDGRCPTGRVYETRLVAVDVCGNAAASEVLVMGVHHDRGHAPRGGTVYAGGHDGEVSGEDGLYGAGCGTGSTCVNGGSKYRRAPR